MFLICTTGRNTVGFFFPCCSVYFHFCDHFYIAVRIFKSYFPVISECICCDAYLAQIDRFRCFFFEGCSNCHIRSRHGKCTACFGSLCCYCFAVCSGNGKGIQFISLVRCCGCSYCLAFFDAFALAQSNFAVCCSCCSCFVSLFYRLLRYYGCCINILIAYSCFCHLHGQLLITGCCDINSQRIGIRTDNSKRCVASISSCCTSYIPDIGITSKAADRFVRIHCTIDGHTVDCIHPGSVLECKVQDCRPESAGCTGSHLCRRCFCFFCHNRNSHHRENNHDGHKQ